MLRPNLNIHSKAKSYEAKALTNPTELSRQLGLLDRPYPLYDKDCQNLYADVDTAYFKVIRPYLLKHNLLETDTAIQLMSRLIAYKLGFDYYYSFNSNLSDSLYEILNYYSENNDIFDLKHNVGKLEGFWYSPTYSSNCNNGFIKSLNKALLEFHKNSNCYIPNNISKGTTITIHFPVTSVNSLYEKHPVNKSKDVDYQGNLLNFCHLLKYIDPKSYVLFGDNILNIGKSGQASIRDCDNSFGIPTKWKPSNDLGAFFNDKSLPSIKECLDPYFNKLKSLKEKGYNLYIANTGIGTGLSLKDNPHSTEEVSKYFIMKLEQLGVDFSQVAKPFVQNKPKRSEIPLVPQESLFTIPETERQIKLVISGGQTGADIGALIGASKLKVKTSGFAPYDFITEEGSKKKFLSDLGLIEDMSLHYCSKTFDDYKQFLRYAYRSRTELNVIFSDGTIIFDESNGYITSGNLTPGCKLTVNFCEKYNKPYLINPKSDQFNTWAILNNIQILNVAGNRESKNFKIERKVSDFMYYNLI